MVYKHHRLELSEAYKLFEKPEINLKLIPSVTGGRSTPLRLLAGMLLMAYPGV